MLVQRDDEKEDVVARTACHVCGEDRAAYRLYAGKASYDGSRKGEQTPLRGDCKETRRLMPGFNYSGY